MAYDLVIRGGNLVDGTGAAPRAGDVAIQDGRIAAVGRVSGAARAHDRRRRARSSRPASSTSTRTTTARRPGIRCSRRRRWHGVTTLGDGQLRRRLRAGAPGPARLPDRADGGRRGHSRAPRSPRASQWEWESFPEYLDALERRRFACDVGTQVPHGAVRAYVMGERGANERAGDAGRHRGDGRARARGRRGRRARLLDLAHDRAPRDHRRAGARHVRRRGRAVRHRARARRARARGLRGRGRGRGGRGHRRAACARSTGCGASRPRSAGPSRSRCFRSTRRRELWRELLELSADAVREGAQIFPQVAGRPFGLLIGHQTKVHPFSAGPTCAALLALPFEERMRGCAIRR